MNGHKICDNIKQIKQIIGNAQLIVVSKFRTLEELQEVYLCGERTFGENRVQEMVEKHSQLPSDIQWHLIGHLQKNKVKYIAPFVSLIHSIDSLSLLSMVNNEAIKNNRVIEFLFQIHIADEEEKFGLRIQDFQEFWHTYIESNLSNVKCLGLMGMATNTSDTKKIKQEFSLLQNTYYQFADKYQWKHLSMGMSGDYEIAIQCGSSMVRIGSKIFS